MPAMESIDVAAIAMPYSPPSSNAPQIARQTATTGSAVDFIDTPYKHLSSGMKVRIAFAVISRLEEPILLVDEVLAVGDKSFKSKCYQRIEELLSSGRTLFFVSHNEADLRRFCTRGLYLNKGGLALDAGIDDVLARYAADYPTL